MAYHGGGTMHKETPGGMGEKCDVKSDAWPRAKVVQSRLNGGADTNWRGSRKQGAKKKLMVK